MVSSTPPQFAVQISRNFFLLKVHIPKKVVGTGTRDEVIIKKIKITPQRYRHNLYPEAASQTWQEYCSRYGLHVLGLDLRR